MSADWYPGIKAFCSHWRHAPMLQQTFETLEREFADENDACIDAAKGLVECACRVLIEELDNPLSPQKPETAVRMQAIARAALLAGPLTEEDHAWARAALQNTGGKDNG